MKRKRDRVLNTKDVKNVVIIPKDVATILRYPVGTNFEGKEICCICKKEKLVTKLKYIGNGQFRCEIPCKRQR